MTEQEPIIVGEQEVHPATAELRDTLNEVFPESTERQPEHTFDGQFLAARWQELGEAVEGRSAADMLELVRRGNTPPESLSGASEEDLQAYTEGMRVLRQSLVNDDNVVQLIAALLVYMGLRGDSDE